MKRNGHLTLDGEHRYWLNGRRVIGVTEILRLSGWINGDFYTEEARYRGTYVHAACHIINTGRLKWDSVRPGYRPYIEAYCAFLEETGFTVSEAERRDHHPTLQFAGTWDLYGIFPHRKTPDIGDIKTGRKEKWWKFQSAAYRGIKMAQDDLAGIGRFSLELRDNGEYHIERHDNHKHDWEVFDASRIIALERMAA